MAEHPELVTAAQAEAASATFAHPWNPNSEMTGVQLGRMAGLKRTGVNLARMAPGRESFVLHAHATEEEWIYILSGRGTAVIGEAEVEVGSGDFMGFPTPSVAHQLRNTGAEDLVYLMGGEHHEVEIATFPGLGRQVVRHGADVQVFELKDAKRFGPLEE